MKETLSLYITKFRTKLYDIYESTISAWITRLFSSQVSILFLGIDNAGKTTLLNLLKDTQSATKPTNHPTSTEIEIGKMSANVFDLGGHEPARMIWKQYFYKCDGVVFIIDPIDNTRFEDVRMAFECVMHNCTSISKKAVPVSVLVNKMDLVYKSFGGDGQRVEAYASDVLTSCGIVERENVKVTFVSMLKDADEKRHDKGIYDSFVWLEGMVRKAEKTQTAL